MSSPYQRALLIANPIAGAGRGEARARALEKAVGEAGIEAELRLTTGAGDARRFAAERSSEVDVVVSIGGDGTLREILDGLQASGDTSTPVATLPMGTANVLAIDFRLPKTIHGVVELLRTGTTRDLDLGHIGTGEGESTTSFLAIGAGLDGEVVQRLDAGRTGAISKFTYVPHVIRALVGYKPPVLRVALDGKPLHGTFGQVLIANVINYGGFLKLDPGTQSDDGLWEVYLWRRGNRRELSRSAIRGATSHLPGGPCTMLRAKRVEITSDAPTPYHVDGDAGGQTPLVFEVTGKRQAIVVPRAKP
jgi:diacylglycerol kinase (ATP)